jgi:hypothetical protein
MKKEIPEEDKKHGYVLYTKGCRCDVCREAKRMYSKAQRALRAYRLSKAKAKGYTYIVSGITHGYSGYQNFKCRCDVCKQGKILSYERWGR